MKPPTLILLSGSTLTLGLAALAASFYLHTPSPSLLDYQTREAAAASTAEQAYSAAQARVWDRAWVNAKLQDASAARDQAKHYGDLAAAERETINRRSSPFFYGAGLLFLASASSAFGGYVARSARPAPRLA